MPPLYSFDLPGHGACRSTFEGDPTLHKSVGLAVALASVFATGVWLIVCGLL